MGRLTKSQARVLRWLAANKCTSAGWLEGGRNAEGPPEGWDAIRLGDGKSSITVGVKNWSALHGLYDVAPSPDVIFATNAVGAAALAEVGG